MQLLEFKCPTLTGPTISGAAAPLQVLVIACSSAEKQTHCSQSTPLCGEKETSRQLVV